MTREEQRKTALWSLLRMVIERAESHDMEIVGRVEEASQSGTYTILCAYLAINRQTTQTFTYIFLDDMIKRELSTDQMYVVTRLNQIVRNFKEEEEKYKQNKINNLFKGG